MQGFLTPEAGSGPEAPADSSSSPSSARGSAPARAQNALSALRLFVLMLALVLVSRFFVVVPAGERGVLLRFGAVQEQILPEGLHPLLPLVFSVRPLTVRVQTLSMRADAAARDLQDVSVDIALNWHLDPEKVNRIFQRLGDEQQVAASVIRPAIEDSLKEVVAGFTAAEIVTERPRLKQALEQLLASRLAPYDLGLDDVDLLQVTFSQQFREAVEAKQVAEQEARRAQFEAVKAQRMAEARVFTARGEAQAQQLLQAGLTPEVLEHEAIEKWNGHLPLVIGGDAVGRFDFKSLLKADRKLERGGR
ncbi:prohibitin family protein [Vulcanococcus limneticus]|uniref:prohibitin family protein n=1 Tax=Vulcanococcus limneticus TaxID=2170428 RepID=UPI00398C20DD